MRKILFSFLSVHFLTDSDSDLDNIIEEVDEDGSGTLDFDEFMEMMAG
jgi:Ca2+-binding EF-hand superfamily protein